jgi:hypothetical protein
MNIVSMVFELDVASLCETTQPRLLRNGIVHPQK